MKNGFFFPRVRLFVMGVLAVALLMVAVPAGQAAAYAETSNSTNFHDSRYLALGDSLAFGYQPDQDFTHGYADILAQVLHREPGTSYINLACPGENSTTMINGGCVGGISKVPYQGSQLDAAVAYLTQNLGKVRLLTLHIGSNDLLPLVNPQTCQINEQQFPAVLQQFKANYTTILTRLRQALTVNGKVTGKILVLDYYQPLQNVCPNTIPFTQQLNETLKAQLTSSEALVPVFDTFGGATVPNENICTWTWICTDKVDIHPNDEGYKVIAVAVLRTIAKAYIK